MKKLTIKIEVVCEVPNETSIFEDSFGGIFIRNDEESICCTPVIYGMELLDMSKHEIHTDFDDGKLANMIFNSCGKYKTNVKLGKMSLVDEKKYFQCGKGERQP